MEHKYHSYWALFNYADDGISICFPDLPGCISCAYSTEEAIQMAKEALMLYLEDMPDAKPKATELDLSVLKPTEIPFLIEVYL